MVMLYNEKNQEKTKKKAKKKYLPILKLIV